MTTSVVSFTPSRDDHGSSLACRAKNPTMAESVEEDTWTMNIQYKPKISLQLGTKLNLENIQENNDVYLECRADANPPVDEVSWQFNGNELQASENVLVSKNFLVIRRVQTHHSGLYSCGTENSEGRTQGETLELRVERSAAKIYSNALLIVVVVSVSLLCLLPLIVFAAVKLRRSDFFNKRHVAKKDSTESDACPSTTTASPQEAMQL
ncbi:hypothetical protein MRX96_057788 [Rhipicephalus microplus]